MAKTLEQRRAEILVADPGFQYSFRMHQLLAHCYAGQKPERLKAYDEAEIGKSLRAAQRRANAQLKAELRIEAQRG